MATTTNSSTANDSAQLNAAMAAMAVADKHAAKPDPTANTTVGSSTEEDLHVPISTGADITSECESGANSSKAKSPAGGAKAACATEKPACAVAAAIAAAPCKVMAAIKAVVSGATGNKTSACAGSNTTSPKESACSSLTAMNSSAPPMIIKPVLTPTSAATAVAALETTTEGKAAPATTAESPAAASNSGEKKLSLQELVHSLSQELNSPNKCMKRVRSLMERFDASGGEWRRYAFWDSATNYTRNLIATDQKTFTLMQLCWNPSKWSPCHDHNGSECFMRMVEGQLVEVRYAWPEAGSDMSKPLKIVGQTALAPGAVCFINDSLGLHKVGNPSASVPAVSLHCYIPGYDTCRAWCQPDKSAKCIEANISYYSELGKKACH